MITRTILYLTLFTIPIFYGCRFHDNREVYLLPKKFQGVVLIISDDKYGMVAEKKDEKLIYTIPENGVLITKEKIESSISEIKYYYDSEIPSNEIKYCSGCKLPRKPVMIFKGSKGVYEYENTKLSYTVFLVGTKENEDSLYQVLDNLNPVEIFDSITSGR